MTNSPDDITEKIAQLDKEIQERPSDDENLPALEQTRKTLVSYRRDLEAAASGEPRTDDDDDWDDDN